MRAEDLICEDCQAQLELPGDNICTVCGTELEQDSCPHCAESVPLFKLARSTFLFKGPVKELIHAFKYQSYQSVAPWLVRSMLETFHAEPRFADCDLVTAVPLHPVRQRERGFNQSELLARQLARHLGLDYAMPVKRAHHTASQTRLSKTQREHNLDTAFSLRAKSDIKGRHILLIDDVFTTGTTVNKLSGMLIAGGASSVSVLTAARAV